MNIKPGHIFIVSNDELHCSILTHCLVELDYDITVEKDGLFEMDIIRAKNPDVIMLDIHTPELNTDELLKSLKADESLHIVPVIMILSANETDAIERSFALGADDYLLKPFSPSVIKVLAHDYLEISRQRLEDLNRAKQTNLLKIEHDVEIARQIQLGFLPSELPQPQGYDIAARFHPARQVAGDWYDAFFMINKRRVGFMVGDVCDKGVGSALFMALFRSLLRSFAQQNLSLRWMDSGSDDWLTVNIAAAKRKTVPSTGTTAIKSAVEITNDYICENHATMNYFATLFFGVLDPVSGTVTYVNGGHPPAIIVSSTGNIKPRLKGTGPAVGVFPGVDYKIGESILDPGDTLLVFSDGVTDARDPGGALFTEKRFLSLLEKSVDSSKALLDRIESNLYAHIATADQFDDITLLAIHRAPEVQ